MLADHQGRGALSRLFGRHRRDEHRPRTSARRGRRGGAGDEALARPAEHRVPRARAPATRPPAHGPAGRAGAAFLSNSGAEAVEASVKLARVATGRPVIIGVPLWLPRSDRADDGPRPARRTSIAAPSSPCRVRSITPRIRTAIGGRRRARDRRVHLRLGGSAGPDLPPAHLPRDASRRHRRADLGRRRLHRAATGVPAPVPRDHAATASCSSPTRCRPVSADGRDVRGPATGA